MVGVRKVLLVPGLGMTRTCTPSMDKNFFSAFPTTQERNPLLQQDLLHRILDQLAVPLQAHTEEAKATRRALVALAQTCHALSDPALDCLWRKLYSLEPLVRCYAAAQNENSENARRFLGQDVIAFAQFICRCPHHLQPIGLSFSGIHTASKNSSFSRLTKFLLVSCERSAHSPFYSSPT